MVCYVVAQFQTFFLRIITNMGQHVSTDTGSEYMYIIVWEWMFLDSGNIICDETFYTQSQIMVEKVPEFSAESLCTELWFGFAE